MTQKFEPGIVIDPDTMKRILRENTDVFLKRVGSLTVALQELARVTRRLLEATCKDIGEDHPPKVHWSAYTDWRWDLEAFHEAGVRYDVARECADEISRRAWRLLHQEGVDRLVCLALKVEPTESMVGYGGSYD